jgi:hypothetical protein
MQKPLPAKTPREGITMKRYNVYLTHPVYASLYHPLFACGGKWVGKWTKDERQRIKEIISPPSFQRS